MCKKLKVKTLHSMGLGQGWEFSHRCSEQIARFLRKNERMSNSLKITSDSLIFGERPERIAHGRLFIKKEGMSESLVFLCTKKYDFRLLVKNF